MNALLPALLLLSCSGAPAGDSAAGGDSVAADDSTPPASDRLNLIVVMVDTLRADHMSLYGYERQTTPNIDTWAESARVYTDSTSQSFWTAPTIAALFTGVLPAAHRCCSFEGSAQGESEIAPGFPTLAETLSEAGYATAAIYRSGIYDSFAGFDQGFDGFVDARTVTGVSESALEWLDARSSAEPFFLFLHYMDPHTEYAADGDWGEMYTQGIDSDAEGTDEQLFAWVEGTQAPTEADKQRIVGLYDGEIALFDDKFQKLLSGLYSRDLGPSTAILLMSDHGEQLDDHGGWLHLDLWQENIRVPTILQAPGIVPGTDDTPIQTLDLAPTLAALLGIERAPGWMGRDLLGDEPPGEGILLSGSGNQHALRRSDGFKYITSGGQTGLYDLSTDPGEQTNLILDQRDLADEMRADLEEMLERAAEAGEPFFDDR